MNGATLAKFGIFALSMAISLLGVSFINRLAAEIEERLGPSGRISVGWGLFPVLLRHKRACPDSWTRMKALACLLIGFVLFILSANAVL
jgi:hypothetical protein